MNWWFIIGVTAAGILCLIKVIVDRQGKKLPGTITDFVNENGVDFLEPLNPSSPELAHDTAFPCTSVIVTIVLLKVDWI